jgi:hypothetical protein
MSFNESAKVTLKLIGSGLMILAAAILLNRALSCYLTFYFLPFLQERGSIFFVVALQESVNYRITHRHPSILDFPVSGVLGVLSAYAGIRFMPNARREQHDGHEPNQEWTDGGRTQTCRSSITWLSWDHRQSSRHQLNTNIR